MSRFEIAPDEVRSLVDKVKGDFFRELVNVRVAVLFDTRKRESQGLAVFARIRPASEVMRILADPELELDQGGYVMFLDKALFLRLPEDLRIKLIRHELRHCRIVENDQGDIFFRILGHDIEDFRAEVELNQDEPEWRERVRDIYLEAYDFKGKPRPLKDPNQGEMFPDHEVEVKAEDNTTVVRLTPKKAAS